MKFSLYRSFPVTACVLGILGLLLGCLQMRVSFESTNRIASSSPPIKTPISHAEVISASTSNVTPVTSNPLSQKNISDAIAEKFAVADPQKLQGSLRVSNQTNQPLRLALLARQSVAKNAVSHKIGYDVPAHWDFAPQEGSLKGLILSLPQGNLKLDKGDILVAFAQDGSRRYWGPYVVGETSSPVWNTKTQEWQLVLEP